MKNDDKLTLSQLMDGEWQDLDPAESVKTACADDDLKATWSRYHLVRDVIRNEAITVDHTLCSRISQAIDDEPTYSNVSPIGIAGSGSDAKFTDANDEMVTESEPTRQQSRVWRTGLTGAALAACVALATVVGLNFWQGAPGTGTNPGAGVQTIANTSIPGQVLPEVDFVSNKGTYWVRPEAKRSAGDERRLNMLLSTHIESSPTADRTGMLPYSRLVGYDSVKPEQ